MGPCRAPSCAGSAESWNGWVEKDLKDHLIPAPLPWAGIPSTRPGCSGSHPAWPWALQEGDFCAIEQIICLTCHIYSSEYSWVTIKIIILWENWKVMGKFSTCPRRLKFIFSEALVAILFAIWTEVFFSFGTVCVLSCAVMHQSGWFSWCSVYEEAQLWQILPALKVFQNYMLQTLV